MSFGRDTAQGFNQGGGAVDGTICMHMYTCNKMCLTYDKPPCVWVLPSTDAGLRIIQVFY